MGLKSGRLCFDFRAIFVLTAGLDPVKGLNRLEIICQLALGLLEYFPYLQNFRNLDRIHSGQCHAESEFKKKKEMKTDATPSGIGLVALDGMDKLASCRSDFATGPGLVSG